MLTIKLSSQKGDDWFKWFPRNLTIFLAENLRNFCAIFFFELPYEAQKILRAKHKFLNKHNIFQQIDQNLKFQHRFKQLKFYLKIYLQKNYDYAFFNWLLLVTKTSNSGTKIIKIEIRKLKIKNSCIFFIDV